MLASVWLVGSDGASEMVVSGATVSGSSIVHVYDAGVGSRLPSGSIAATRSVCSPRARSVYSAGEVHGLNPAPSSAHSKDEPGTLEESSKLALVLVVVPAG